MYKTLSIENKKMMSDRLVNKTNKCDDFKRENVIPYNSQFNHGSLNDFMVDLPISKNQKKQFQKIKEVNNPEILKLQIKQQIHHKSQNKKQSSNLIRANIDRNQIDCNLIVQNLFHKCPNINAYLQNMQNNKDNINGSSSINIPQLEYKIDQLISNSNHLNQEQQQKLLVNDKQFMNRKVKGIKLKKKKIIGRKKIQTIQNILNKYPSLKKVMNNQCVQNQQQHFQQFIGQNNILLNNKKQLYIAKQAKISTKNIIQMVNKSIKTLKIIQIHNCNIHDDTLCYIIETILEFNQQIQQISLKNIRLKNRLKLCLKIQQLITNSLTLKRLYMENMQINSKQFCTLCLGLGSNRSLQQLQLNNNKITETALKSLQIILKFNKQLIIQMHNNPIKFKSRVKQNKLCL